MGQVRADMNRIRTAVDNYIASMAPPDGFVRVTKQQLHDQETQRIHQRFVQESQVDLPGNGGDLMNLFL